MAEGGPAPDTENPGTNSVYVADSSGPPPSATVHFKAAAAARAAAQPEGKLEMPKSGNGKLIEMMMKPVNSRERQESAIEMDMTECR